GRQVQPGGGVADGVGQADRDPADVVDDRLEAQEVDLDEVVDVDVGDLLQGPPQARRAAGGVGRVELFHRARVRLLAGVSVPVGRAPVDGHNGGAREADHDGAGMGGRDVQQHGGVRAGPLDAAAVPAVGARARVRADDQDVFRAVQLRRPVAQLAGRDVQVVDAVVYAAVGGVGAERDEGDRQRGEDAENAGQRMSCEGP